MSKNVLRYGEFQISNEAVSISLPVIETPEVIKEVQDLEELDGKDLGPSPLEFQEEVERTRKELQDEGKQIIQNAENEASSLKQSAEEEARKIRENAEKESHDMRQTVDSEVKTIIDSAKNEAEQIISEAKAERDKVFEEARIQAVQEGRDEGFNSGAEEVERLIQRLHQILNSAIAGRAELIKKSESQIIQLVLQMVRKIVKVLGEKQRNIVIQNIMQSLKKLKSKSDIVIRVNLLDLDLTTQHSKEIIEKIESVGNVQVMEDSSIEPGGAIIESDFGHIDARISSQFREIEQAVSDVMPITEE